MNNFRESVVPILTYDTAFFLRMSKFQIDPTIDFLNIQFTLDKKYSKNHNPPVMAKEAKQPSPLIDERDTFSYQRKRRELLKLMVTGPVVLFQGNCVF